MYSREYKLKLIHVYLQKVHYYHPAVTMNTSPVITALLHVLLMCNYIVVTDIGSKISAKDQSMDKEALMRERKQKKTGRLF